MRKKNRRKNDSEIEEILNRRIKCFYFMCTYIIRLLVEEEKHNYLWKEINREREREREEIYCTNELKSIRAYLEQKRKEGMK